MVFHVYIRHNPTGVTRRYAWESQLSDADVEYQWHDGNLSCDCNRRIFFDKSGGEEMGKGPCGDKEFSVKVVNAKTGLVVFDNDTSPL